MTAAEPRPRDALGRPLARGATDVDHGVDVEAPRSDQQSLTVAQDLLDRGYPFAAHEVLEARWRSASPEGRDWWQALAQVCVALTHVKRGNLVGGERLLQRSRLSLEQADPQTQPPDVDLVAITRWIEQTLIAIDSAEREPSIEPLQLVVSEPFD